MPAIAESYPGFAGDSWHVLFAPKGTPGDVIAALVAQSQRIVDAPDFRAVLREVSLTPVGGGSDAFRRFLADDAKAWGEVVREHRISVD